MDFLLHDVYLPGSAPHHGRTKTSSAGRYRPKQSNETSWLSNPLLNILRDSRKEKEDAVLKLRQAAQNTPDNEWQKQVLRLKLSQVCMPARSADQSDADDITGRLFVTPTG